MPEEVVSIALYEGDGKPDGKPYGRYAIGQPRGFGSGQSFAKHMGQSCVIIPRNSPGVLNTRGLYCQIRDAMVKDAPCHVLSNGCKRQLFVDGTIVKSQEAWPRTYDINKARKWERKAKISRCDIEYRNPSSSSAAVRIKSMQFDPANTHYGLVCQQIMQEICGLDKAKLLYTGGGSACLPTHHYIGPQVTNEELIWTLAPGSEARHFSEEVADALEEAADEHKKADKKHVKAVKQEAKAAQQLAKADTLKEVKKAMDTESEAVKTEIQSQALDKEAKVDEDLAAQMLILEGQAAAGGGVVVVEDDGEVVEIGPDGQVKTVGGFFKKPVVKWVLIALGVLLVLMLLAGAFAAAARRRRSVVNIEADGY